MLLLALLAISGLLAVMQPQFVAPANLLNVIRQIAINGILAVGVTFVLLTGGVDLSLGSIVALAGVVAAGSAQSGGMWPLGLGLLAGVLTGGVCGAVNGLVITRARVAPFIVTLGMMTAARGLALVVSNGRPVSHLDRTFTSMASTTVLGVPVPVVIFAAVALAAHLFLKNFRLGRYIYAVGGNEHAARASGLSVANIKLLAYTICGLAAGLAGVVLAARITTGQPNAGVGYELDAITAAVIGGTSLAGGVGQIHDTVLGVVLIGVINNGLDLLNVPSYYQLIVKGIIIIAAVCFDRRNLD